MSFARMREAVDTLAPFLDETQTKTLHQIILDNEGSFTQAVQYVLHKNLTPGDKHASLSTPQLWVDAIESCINMLNNADLVFTDRLKLMLTEERKCVDSCSSPCEMRRGKCSFEKHPVWRYLKSSAGASFPWALRGCGLSALVKGLPVRNAQLDDTEVVTQQEAYLTEIRERREIQRKQIQTESETIAPWRTGDDVDRESEFVKDTCLFCSELRGAGVIS
jgi:hypothetical protein